MERSAIASKIYWDAISAVDGPVRDSREVAAIIQLMDEQTSLAALERLGRRIHKTKLADCDRAALRQQYKACVECLEKLGADMRPAASEKQIRYLRRCGVPEYKLAAMTKDEARTEMGRVKRKAG